MRFAGRVAVLEAELVGILEALLWSEELAVRNVKVESDSMLGVKAINKPGTNYLELGDLVRQCRSILDHKNGVSVGYIRKRANEVAHKMARIPCELNSFVISPSPPILLLETLLSDISMN